MIHSRKDIEDNCTIPIVGEIPEKRADQLDKEIIVSETGRDRISESFRIVRSNLDYMITPDKFTDGTVIQLTSQCRAKENRSSPLTWPSHART